MSAWWMFRLGFSFEFLLVLNGSVVERRCGVVFVGFM